MHQLFFNNKREHLPSNFQDQLNALIDDGAQQMESVPHKFDPDIVCVIPNGTDSSCIYSFQDVKEFNQFRNIVLRNPDKNTVRWFKYRRTNGLNSI